MRIFNEVYSAYLLTFRKVSQDKLRDKQWNRGIREAPEPGSSLP